MVNKIKEISDKKNIPISSIIKKTKLSKSFIYDVIKDEKEPSLTNSRKIAHVLGESLDEVFPEREVKQE